MFFCEFLGVFQNCFQNWANLLTPKLCILDEEQMKIANCWIWNTIEGKFPFELIFDFCKQEEVLPKLNLEQRLNLKKERSRVKKTRQLHRDKTLWRRISFSSFKKIS